MFSALAIGAFGAAGFAVGLLGAGDVDDGWEELGWILLGTAVGLAVGIAVWVVLTVWLVRRPGAHNGQTLGKQAVGIRAVRADGSQIAIGTAMLRELLAKGLLIGFTSSLVSTMLGFVDAGLLGAVVAVCVFYGPALFDERRRGLHDRLCGTLVVLARRLAAEPATVPDDDLWAATPQR